MIKKYFGTGLVILLPLMITLYIVSFILDMLTAPFQGIMEKIISQITFLNQGFLFLSKGELITMISDVFILAFLFVLIVGLGFLGRWFFIHYLIELGELLLQKIPFVNKVYKMAQEVIRTLFGNQANSFKQVVMVPFPSQHAYTIGFLTGIPPQACRDHLKEESLMVYVPTTPNPTSGYLMMFKKEDVVVVDLSVEEGLKFLISCGVVAPFNPKEKMSGS